MNRSPCSRSCRLRPPAIRVRVDCYAVVTPCCERGERDVCVAAWRSTHRVWDRESGCDAPAAETARPDQPSPVVHATRTATDPARTTGIDWCSFPGARRSTGLMNWRRRCAPGAGYEELVDAAGIWRGWFYFTIVPAADVARLKPLLDLLNVGYSLALPDVDPSTLAGAVVPAGDRLQIARRPTAWPKAFFPVGVTIIGQRRICSGKSPRGPQLAGILANDPRALEATRTLPRALRSPRIRHPATCSRRTPPPSTSARRHPASSS